MQLVVSNDQYWDVKYRFTVTVRQHACRPKCAYQFGTGPKRFAIGPRGNGDASGAGGRYPKALCGRIVL